MTSKNNIGDYQFPATDCISVFCELMEVKAEQLGLSLNTLFNDPCGIDNYSTAKDMARCLIRGNESCVLKEIWSKDKYVVKVFGENAREIEILSTVKSDSDSHILTDSYEISGGKTGTLSPYGAFNISFIAKIPGSEELLACTVMYAKEKNGFSKNRFQAAKEALDIAVKKYKDDSFDTSACEVCADNIFVCVVPPVASSDEYHAKLRVLFEKESVERKMPASMTKILTAIIALENLNDLDEKICVSQDVIDIIPDKFYHKDFLAGDVVTVRDVLHAMMLSSSNAGAYIIANHVGNKIFSDNM